MSTGIAAPAVNPTLRQGLNVVGYLVVVTVNALANALPINGIISGAVSDRFPTFVTPAGYVFAIWGVIYALLAVFAVYQALPAQRDDPTLQRLGLAFVASCACNAAWLFAWHYLLIGVAWALIVALLVTLIVCYERLRTADATTVQRLAVRLPFSVYLGWVTVATVANTAILAVDAGVDGGAAAPVWGVAALLAATGIGATVLVRRGDLAFAGVVVWALAGIAVAQADRSQLVTIVAAVLAVLLAGAAVAVAVRGAPRTRMTT